MRFKLPFLLATLAASALAQQPRVNEIMASNVATILDEDGEASDWLEIHNPSATPLNLVGWGLSDDPEEPFKWVFPANTMLRAGGYLLVWASGKNRYEIRSLTEEWFPSGGEWVFEEGNGNGASGWTESGFDDSAWTVGHGPFGYGPTVVVETNLNPASEVVRFRRTFEVANSADWDALELELASHLGAVVYINGVEVKRWRMPDGPLSPTTRASLLPGAAPDLWVAGDGAMSLRADGDELFVTQWMDLSGNNRHPAQASANLQPRFIAAASGQPAAVRFDGVDDRLLSPAFQTGNEASLFAVGRFEGGGSYARAVAKGGASAGFSIARGGTGSTYLLRVDTSALVNQIKFGGNLFDNTLQSFGFSVEPNLAIAFRNGVEDFRLNLAWGNGIANESPLAIGSVSSGAGPYFKGDFSEMLFWNSTLNVADWQAVTAFLQEKYFPSDTVGSQTLRIEMSAFPGLLVEGTNTIAVEIRQRETTDDTFYFDLALRGVSYLPVLHTNFSMNSGGEPVVLTAPGGQTVHLVAAMEGLPDISRGLQPDGANDWFLFDQPTPGASNTGTPYFGVTASPDFSVRGGFHPADVNLALAAEPGAVIHYSLDGSEPEASRVEGETYGYKGSYPRMPGDPFGPMLTGVMNTMVYSSPITIGDRTVESNRLSGVATWFETAPQPPAGNLRKATVVRARAVKPGYLPSEVVTHTYFVGPDVATRYALPVISLAADDADLFGHESGIYVPGKLADQWRQGAPFANWPRWMIPANYQQRGDAWERPVHFEMFTPSGERVVSKDLGSRIHGGATREFYRKSFRLYARSRYDPGDLSYPFFPGLEKKGFPGVPLEDFDAILLRNSGNEAAGILFLDALCQGLVAHLPLSTQAYQPALHYINGESWGIINIRERIDENYLREHYGVEPEQSVIVSNNGVIAHGTTADRQHYYNLVNYVEANSPANATSWNHVITQMDPDNHALYYAFQIYIANLDWPENNIDYWRKITPAYLPGAPYGHDGRWRWLVYDTELGFNPSNVALDTLRRISLTAEPGTLAGEHTRLFRALLQSSEYRRLLCNHLADLMNSAFVPGRVNEMIDEFNARLAPARPEHFQRWQSGSDFNGGQIYKDFAANRPEHVRQHVVARFGLGGTYQLTVDTPNPSRGSVKVNGLLINGDLPGVANSSAPYPWSGVYFQGIPVRVEAVAKPGYRFAGWIDQPEGTPEVIEANPSAAATFTASFEPVAPLLPIHAWDHESASSFLQSSFTVGGASLAATPAPGGTVERNTTAQGFTTAHLRVNNPLGASLLWNLPTTGHEDIQFTYSTRRSGQGAGQQTIEYTLDGSTWQVFGTFLVLDADPQSRALDFSAIPGAENNPNFAIRATFSRDAAQISAGTGLAGNQRFDDVVLKGRALPGTNRPPEILATPELVALRVGASTSPLNLSAFFSDPEGDELTYSAVVNPPGDVHVAFTGNEMHLTAMAAGNATVMISADDGIHDPVPLTFNVLSHPVAHAIATDDFHFTRWDANQPAGSFPASMIFLQGEGNNDSTLATPLTRAYEIPPADAALPADSSFPYAAGSRTRINGLGEQGISFLNTGRGRDLGAAVVALDTRGADRLQLLWTAGTVTPGAGRQYALRLQARADHSGPFQDVLVAGAPLEYQNSTTAGEKVTLGPVELPPSWLGREYIQLSWRYHQTGGTSGSRDELSLDDIAIFRGDPEAWETWRLSEFLSPEDRLNPAISGPLAEHGGVENLTRYALGAGLHDSPDQFLPVLDGAAGDRAFRIKNFAARADVRYRVARSTDLVDWTNTIFDTAIDNVSAYLEGGDLMIPVPPSEKTFLRLETSLP